MSTIKRKIVENTITESIATIELATKLHEETANKLNLNKDECLMIGNDTSEDYIVTELGIPCIILKDCLINKKNLDIDFMTLEDLYKAVKHYSSLINE